MDFIFIYKVTGSIILKTIYIIVGSAQVGEVRGLGGGGGGEGGRGRHYDSRDWSYFPTSEVRDTNEEDRVRVRVNR